MTIDRKCFYSSNEDVIVAVAQCGEYIRSHAGDLIGKVIGDKSGDIRTSKLKIVINLEAAAIPTIIVNKDTLMPIVIPFDEVGD